ncbi:MAG TPA: putative quinol monooxygenase [Terriglobales bacterium]
MTPSSQPLCLAVHLLIREGAEAQAVACFEKLAPASRAEPGCLGYNVHRSIENPRRFLIYELYRDEAALQAHRDSAHFAQYATGELYWLVEGRQAEKFAPVMVAG